MLSENFLFGVKITSAEKKEILEYILQGLQKRREKYYIVTPNPEILVYASKHKGFKSILNHARLGLCDGVGLIWGGKILGLNLKERMTGTDFVKSVCKMVCEKPITVGFLGGGPGVADKTAECLRLKYPKLKVSFAAEEWNEGGLAQVSQCGRTQNKMRKNAEEVFSVIQPSIQRDSALTIDILFVAFGSPKQEEWIAKNLPQLPVKIAVGVGGAFDYISGKIPRAPLWIQKSGFEWLYRLIRQPWRLKRQLALLEFIFLIFKEKIKQSNLGKQSML
ncbi:MAG: WecB/TagA/CpsF family glycosyltransferase [Patescibacteria group bacterium]